MKEKNISWTKSLNQVDILLQKYRNQIDLIDKELINLFSERFELVELIWILKKENNIPFLQPDRFKKVLESIIEYAKHKWINPVFVEEIWKLIHTESLWIENIK
jgi:chorismate mutase